MSCPPRASEESTIAAKVIIAVPSRGQMSINFVRCLVDLAFHLAKENVLAGLSIQGGPFLPHVRAKACGADVARGALQQPFDDDTITHIMMLDDDMIFTPQQVSTLLARNKDVVSGMYPYGPPAYTHEDAPLIAGYWDEEFFEQNYTMPYLTVEQARKKAKSMKQELIPVDWVGLGFLLIKTKVFRRVPYPWFQPRVIRMAGMVDSTSEDVGFCYKIKKAGFDIWLDTTVAVSHEKSILLGIREDES